MALCAAAATAAAFENERSGGALQSDETYDVIHGVRVPDPFRWLEEDHSERTKEWLDAQRAQLERSLGPADRRESVRARLTELVRFDTVSTPRKAGNHYFFTRVGAGQSQNAKRLIVRSVAGGVERELKVTRSADEIVAAMAPSPDGRRVVIGVSNPKAGTSALRVVQVSDATLLQDAIGNTRGLLGSPEWLPDSSAFYYAAAEKVGDEESITRFRVWRHRVGDREPAEIGALPAERGLVATPNVTDDGRYLVISLQRGTDPRSRVLVQDLSQPNSASRDIVPPWSAAFTFLGSDGNRFWFYTDDQAPRGRVVVLDVSRPPQSPWREIVPQQPEAISARDQTGIDPIGMYGGRLVLTYIRDGQPFIRVYGKDGTLHHTIDLPPAGSIWNGFSGSATDSEVFYWFLGLTDPSTIYRLDVTTGRTSLFVRPTVPFDRSRYVVKQDFYRSADGTRIPIFVAHRRDFKNNTAAPTWLYAYGALGWVSFIWYQPHILAWLEMGGVYAQPSIRGGGEYGEAWHHAALKTKKSKAVEDYIAAAEWLLQERYTTRARLVANGGSLSAPLAGAAVHRRADLFGAAVIDRPVTDMIRYERFTGGTFWAPEFGSVNEPAEFRSLLSLSPYHNSLAPACHPPTLVLAGDLDRTAPPLHARKLTAALQHSQKCDNPVRLKMMPGATHNFGNTPEQTVDSFTDLLSFLATVLKLPRATSP